MRSYDELGLLNLRFKAPDFSLRLRKDFAASFVTRL